MSEDINLHNQEDFAKQDFEQELRPSDFSDFEGQEKIIENLKVFIKAARQREDALDHVWTWLVWKNYIVILLQMNYRLV